MCQAKFFAHNFLKLVTVDVLKDALKYATHCLLSSRAANTMFFSLFPNLKFNFLYTFLYICFAFTFFSFRFHI